MQQLSGLDATFLYFETEQTPMHVAGLTLYDLPEDFEGSVSEHFRTFFAKRVHIVPLFSKKLARTVFELDHPGWVDAGEPDLDYHIQAATLPAPGDLASLEALVAGLHSQPLDRKMPLWQFTVIDGLEPGPDGQRQAALYSKVHHAAIDGGAGMAITKALYDLGPVPREVDEHEYAPVGRKPSVAERAILGAHDMATNIVTQQMKALEAIPKVMEAGLNVVSKLGSVDPVKELTRQFAAPKTPFNATMGRKRSYCARTLPLSDAKAIAKATGTKLNDVVMAICSGAMRQYLAEKKKLPGDPLVAFVPISTREANNADMNNQVFGMNVPLASDIANPLKRLAAIHENSMDRKDIAGTASGVAPSDFTLIGAPLLLPGLMQLYGKTRLSEILPQAVNVCISNTMGPPFPLYCAGAKVTALYPVSIATHGVGLNFTVQSYMNSLNFGLTAGQKAVPDVDHMGDLLITAFEELKRAALPTTAAPSPSEASDTRAPAKAEKSTKTKAKTSGETDQAPKTKKATSTARAAPKSKTAAKTKAAAKKAAPKNNSTATKKTIKATSKKDVKSKTPAKKSAKAKPDAS